VRAVEKLAARRGCTHVHLHSMNFQAVEFYRKLGYRHMAQLVGRPGVYTRYFLSKALPKAGLGRRQPHARPRHR
jgi:ribosomal protein S18 acetylase RimI-like enzyme